VNDQNLRKKLLAANERECTQIKKRFFSGANDLPGALAGQWTEGESYYQLRRTNRQTRTPMREVGRVVIEKFAVNAAVTR